MFPLRLCGGKLLVAAVTRERRYGPSRLRVNDDDDDDDEAAARRCYSLAIDRRDRQTDRRTDGRTPYRYIDADR